MNPMIEDQKHGYWEAAKIDSKINDLIQKYPLEDKENYMFWKTFTRTVKTSLEIIEELIKEQNPKSTN